MKLQTRHSKHGIRSSETRNSELGSVTGTASRTHPSIQTSASVPCRFRDPLWSSIGEMKEARAEALDGGRAGGAGGGGGGAGCGGGESESERIRIGCGCCGPTVSAAAAEPGGPEGRTRRLGV